MKSIRLTLIISLTSVITVLGQDYQTIISKRISYFDNHIQNIKCIRIDSVKHQTDSIFYPYAVFQQLNYNCFSPNVASWIGKEVVINENGENYFYNKINNRINLKTKAKLDDKWIAYQSCDSLIIEATIIKYDTMSFLNLIDSVKIIGFQSYNKDMKPIDLEINNMNIIISKNYGFVKTFNFYLFPNYQVDYPSEKFEEYNLIGLSIPKTGIQNLTWFEVYDFQIDDELHILDESSNWFYDGSGSATTDKAIYKYINRTDYLDSIVYQVSRKQSIYKTWGDSSSFVYYNDTINSIIKPDSLFDKLPGDPIFEEYMAYSFYMTNELPLSKTNNSFFEFFVYYNSCWDIVHVDGCFRADSYVKGLGGPYYWCNNDFSFGGLKRQLVFYKKGEVTWGNPLVITNIDEIDNNFNVIIYPNPAKDFIKIKYDVNANFTSNVFIYDIKGTLIKYQRLESPESNIDISNLGNGFYIIKVTNDNKIIKIDKLIIL